MNAILTYSCGFRCRHCCMSSKPGRHHMKYETWLQLCELLHGRCSEINLIGGEATRHPRFGDILMDCIKHFDTISLITNGEWILSEKKTELLKAQLIKAINNSSMHDNWILSLSNDRYHQAFLPSSYHPKVMAVLEECLESGDGSHKEDFAYKRGDHNNIEPFGRGKDIARGCRPSCSILSALHEDYSLWNAGCVDIAPNGKISPCNPDLFPLGTIWDDPVELEKRFRQLCKLVDWEMQKYPKPDDVSVYRCSWCIKHISSKWRRRQKRHSLPLFERGSDDARVSP